MRRPLIAGNWKMYKTPSEAVSLALELKQNIGTIQQLDMLVCPPSINIVAVRNALQDSLIKVGGQNLYWEQEGAFTGEISPQMLKEAGCEYVIVGHSERRHKFGETNEEVNQKTRAALNAGLKPIVCIGETLEQREQNQTEAVLDDQLKNSLAGIKADLFQNIVIAYEPVWAIGTGRTATPEQAGEAHEFIRNLLDGTYSVELAENQIILYGGSVKPDNIKQLMTVADIDGVLVGGASLKSDLFSKIVKYFQ